MAASPEADGRKFPYRSVIIMALCLTVNGYTLVNLFPYVGMMVRQLLQLPTINESGYYAGYVASSFTFGRFLSAYVWGHAADVIGRKPVIVTGLSAIVVCSVAFGLSTSFAFAIASRFVLGLFNGIMPAVRTMTRELCGPEHVVRGMTYIMGSRGIGLVVGTAIGGLLAQPAINFPNIVSSTGLFGRHPFLLPNLFGASFALVAIPLVLFYLPETKKDHKPHAGRVQSRVVTVKVSPEGPASPETVLLGGRKTYGGQVTYQALEDGTDREERPPQQRGSAVMSDKNSVEDGDSSIARGDTLGMELTSTKDIEGMGGYEPLADDRTRGDGSRESERGDPSGLPTRRGPDPGQSGLIKLLATPNVKLILFIACILQTVVIGFEETYPLWALSTPSVGGLGWGTVQIGKVLGVAGVILAVLQLGLFPQIIEKVGMVNWQRAGCLVGVPAFLGLSSIKLLSWDDRSLFVMSVVSQVLVNCCVGAVMLLLTVASTSIVPQHERGKLGGLLMTAEGLGRFIGPAGFSSLFAWSISPSAYRWVDYHFVFILYATVFAVIAGLTWATLTLDNMTKPAQEGKARGSSAIVAGEDTKNLAKEALMQGPVPGSTQVAQLSMDPRSTRDESLGSV